MNDVNFHKSYVTLIRVQQINLVLLKPKQMKNKAGNTNQAWNNEKTDFQGYPIYPADEDIYSKYYEEKEINPEDISQIKESYGEDILISDNENIFNHHASGRDLDIPGSELDDSQENIGSEDEENNYYSLGGDDHIDLDEDQGE